MIVLHDVTKKFGSVTVLDSVSLRIDPGEFVCIMGKSGAGKSVLMAALTGEQTVTSGTIEVDGVNLRTVPVGALQIFRQRVGIIFQDFKLLKQRTVAENIAFPLEVCGAGDRQIKTRVTVLLKRMNLTDRANALPEELSAGEQARTAIARAIAHHPLIVLADEPTGNLDKAQAKEVIELLKEIHAEGGTVILATHDPAILQMLDARVVTLDHGAIISDTAGGLVAHEPVTENEQPEENAVTASDDASDEDLRTRVNAAKKRVPPANRRRVRVTSIHSD